MINKTIKLRKVVTVHTMPKSGMLETITRFAMHRNCKKRSFAP